MYLNMAFMLRHQGNQCKGKTHQSLYSQNTEDTQNSSLYNQYAQINFQVIMGLMRFTDSFSVIHCITLSPNIYLQLEDR